MDWPYHYFQRYEQNNISYIIWNNILAQYCIYMYNS